MKLMHLGELLKVSPHPGFATAIIFVIWPLVAAQNPEPISANDNRTPAGRMSEGVLYLELEIKRGIWHPESEEGEAIPAYAFGEAGRSLQVPGPTIRVPQGTTIDMSLHSSLTVPTIVHGLFQRPGDDGDVVIVPPGETKHVRFEAGTPGTYLYWGRTPDGGRGDGPGNRILDALLGGALVVDPAGADPARDRIFVLERWNGARRTAINGKSWPFTERLSAEVGEEVRWKVINASDLSHPMHLHGFHFWLNAQGDGEAYTAFDTDTRREEFTHSVKVMETFEISWVPREPGRWLYHCHRMPHMRLPVPLDPSEGEIPEHNSDHERMEEWDSGFAGMGGMVMGITVTGHSEIDTVNGWKPGRRLEMNVGNRNGNPGLYEIALKNLDSDEPAAMSTGLTGPLLVVTQGQRTEITLTNSSQAATSVHWHGLEIESYYDGVPWWSGIGEKRAPLVEPGHRFMVKMIPQRAGSFIYHTHWHDQDQLTGGVHGPMIVLPPDQTYDPATDKTFLMSVAPPRLFGGPLLLMNGSPQPPAVMRLETGTRYRFRFMNITPAVDNLHVALMDPTGPVEWRPIAKDAVDMKGADLREAVQQIAIGETFDFEYRARGEQELRLEAWSPGSNQRPVQMLTFED